MEKLPFIPNHVYNRQRDIHDQFGGNRQGGIAPSARYPFIFIFSGQSGHQHGYRDGWENKHIFSYTGEGQSGDMRFVRGNLALRDHREQGKRVFLFESNGRGGVRFIDEVELYEADYFETHDSTGQNRIGIKFFFKRKGAYVPVSPEQLKGIPLAAAPDIPYKEYRPPTATERQGLVTSRVGQGAYRKSILHRWDYQCAVTGFQKLEVLVASHIVPWAESSNMERVDPHNGILLSPTYDALFDRHLISFDKEGRILLSDTIESQAYNQIGVTGRERILRFTEDNLSYLERHRNQFAHH